MLHSCKGWLGCGASWGKALGERAPHAPHPAALAVLTADRPGHRRSAIAWVPARRRLGQAGAPKQPPRQAPAGWPTGPWCGGGLCCAIAIAGGQAAPLWLAAAARAGFPPALCPRCRMRRIRAGSAGDAASHSIVPPAARCRANASQSRHAGAAARVQGAQAGSAARRARPLRCSCGAPPPAPSMVRCFAVTGGSHWWQLSRIRHAQELGASRCCSHGPRRRCPRCRPSESAAAAAHIVAAPPSCLCVAGACTINPVH